MNETFGQYLRDLREDAGIGLRELAELIGQKASNLSAVESGARVPFHDPVLLRKIAEYLELPEHSNRWHRFFDLARRADSPPADTLEQLKREEVVGLLRTLDRVQATPKMLEDLTKMLKQHRGTSTR